MDPNRPNAEQNGYYPFVPGQPAMYQYDQMRQPQHPNNQYSPYYYPPTTAMPQSQASLSPSNGFTNAPQQYHTDYYPQQASHQHQMYAQPAAGTQYPPNPSNFHNRDYNYAPANIPNHPPPAYDGLPSPDEESLEQVEPVSSEQVHEAQAFVEKETLGWIPSAKHVNPRQMRRLEKPVVIPRIGTASRLKPPLPFLRAYSPVLATHDIYEKDFLAFIDNLGVAQAGNPVFKAMNAAGMGIGWVPHHWAMLAGTGIQVAAGVGSSAVSAIRTKQFLEQTNERYFAPRGLKVSLKKDDDLVNCLFSGSGGAQASEYKRVLLAPVDVGSGQIELRQRKMAVLQPYIAPLTEIALPPEQQTNFLDRMAAKEIEKQTKKEEKRLAKRQKKAEKKQMKIEHLRAHGMINDDGYDARKAIHDGSSSSSSDSDSSDSEIEKINRKVEKLKMDPKMSEKKRAKLQAEIDEGRSKYQKKYEKKLAKANRKADKANEKAEKQVKRMEYIVIENL